MRRPFLAGNWKMNLDLGDSVSLARQLRERAGDLAGRDVAVFPTFVSLAGVAQALAGSPIRTGAQNCAAFENGAYTGEVSASIIASAGATLVLLGHSERRHVLGESDGVVNRKLLLADAAGLEPVLCVGETRQERESELTLQVVERQVREGLRGLPRERFPRVTLAYEPVWAIGTGLVATPGQAEAVHSRIRDVLRELCGPVADEIRILYGGSVGGANVAGLLDQTNIDGALVGGASLKVDEFARIMRLGKE